MVNNTIIKISTNKTFVGDEFGNAVENTIALLPESWVTDKLLESTSTEGEFNWLDKTTFASPSDITYETLDANGDVGTSTGQLAAGDHTHLDFENIAEDAIIALVIALGG